jgi:RNA polymerase sigma factor (sigma-70 family)
MLLETYDTNTIALWGEPERRRRLVRVCATISGDPNVAEDLAQETLLEAWRNAHKLHDPSGADRWLAAIARNVCLRWARRRGRDLPITELGEESSPPDDLDIEVELERTELVELLDRALSLLPGDTRDVLVQRYVDESPHADIAARLGVSEDAVSMRLSRGKLVLRRLLASDLRDEAAAHGLLDDTSEWRKTRVWCTECGNDKLVMRREAAPGGVSFRCPRCQPNAAELSAEFRLEFPVFERLVGDLVRPTSILKRVGDWSARYFVGGAEQVECTKCGRAAMLRPHVRDDVDPERGHRHGLVVSCVWCGDVAWSSIAGIALGRPEVRAFRREHPRLRAVPVREVDAGGAALVVRYEDALGSSGVDVLFERDTLRLIGVHAPAN